MERYQLMTLIKPGLVLILSALAFVSEGKMKMEKYQLIGNRQYIYSAEGLREQKLSYNADMKPEKKVLYFFDANGNKIRTEKYLDKDSLIVIYKYEFNRLNQKISSEKTDFLKDAKSSKRYFYNDLGQNTITEYIANGKVLKKVEYKYNEHGHQTEYLVYNSQNELCSAYYTENKYDNKQNLIGKIRRDKDGVLVKTNSYSYNEKAQIAESLTIYHNGKRPNSKRTYTYDNLGRKTGFKKYTSINLKE